LLDRPGTSGSAFLGSELTEFDIIAGELSAYRTRFEAIERRPDEVEKMNERLEDAAQTSASALGSISKWT
jgi:hypothetical protein